MRLLILTTETLHHAHFVREIAPQALETLVLCETVGHRAAYDTAHPFEAARDAWERDHWFGGRDARLADFAATECFASMNEAAAVARIRDFEPSLIVTFGTGKLGAQVIVAGGDRLLNLHGGDPEFYRGLDTHLWAVWHGDFAGLQTCLHRVAAGLDEGDIVATLPVRLWRGMELHQLRQSNTETCIRLTRLAMAELADGGAVTSRRQGRQGRYYSFMPTALKDVCVRKFRKHTAEVLP